MKAITTLLTICFIGCLAACHGQKQKETTTANKRKESAKVDSGKQMNLLDEQTKMYSQIFDMAGEVDNNPLGGATNYLELINKIDLPQEQKEMLYEQYKIYDLSLDPKKRDSLKLTVDTMISKAIEKSKNEQ